MHRPANEVVIYCAVDREFAQPVLDAFTQKTGIKVEAKFDTESTKSVALAEQILRERRRPRCDVFWNNEILHTIRLAREGLCRPTTPSQMHHYPVEFRSKENLWHSLAARARVLLVNTERVNEDQIPQRLEDLAAPGGRVSSESPSHFLEQRRVMSPRSPPLWVKTSSPPSSTDGSKINFAFCLGTSRWRSMSEAVRSRWG